MSLLQPRQRDFTQFINPLIARHDVVRARYRVNSIAGWQVLEQGAIARFEFFFKVALEAIAPAVDQQGAAARTNVFKECGRKQRIRVVDDSFRAAGAGIGAARP